MTLFSNRKIHAAIPLHQRTVCGLKFNGKLGGNDVIEATLAHSKVLVSSKWIERGSLDITCQKCLKGIA